MFSFSDFFLVIALDEISFTFRTCFKHTDENKFMNIGKTIKIRRRIQFENTVSSSIVIVTWIQVFTCFIISFSPLTRPASMRALVVATAFILLIRAGSGLEITVTPEVIELGLTQSFAINCAIVDSEEVRVVNMSISRETMDWDEVSMAKQPSQYDLIASIDYVYPSSPAVAAGYEGVTVQGQITAFESEMGSFLDLEFISPTVHDLGLYSCQATIVSEKGNMESFTAVAKVTTANPMVDRLLLIVSKLESKVNGFNSSLAALTAQVEETKAKERLREKQMEEKKAAKERELEEAEKAEEEAEERSGRRLERLFESLTGFLEGLNSSVSSLDQRVGQLVAEEVEEENETEAEDFIQTRDQIQDYFSTANSSYFLIKSSVTRDAYWAQVACESIGLTLAALDTEQAFLQVTSKIGPIINEGTHVVVSTQRRTSTDLGEDGFISSGYIHPSEFASGDCVVLSKNLVEGYLYTRLVPCATPWTDLFYLCEGAQ